MFRKLMHAAGSLATMCAILLSLNFAVAPSIALAAPPGPDDERYIVVAKSDADYDSLRAEVQQRGGRVVKEMREVGTLVVLGPKSLKGQIASSIHSQGVAKDRIMNLVQPSMQTEMGFNPSPGRNRFDMGQRGNPIHGPPDPAFTLPGLMWDFTRIRAPQAWKITTGSPKVTVGVADTGLDFTHSELASKVTSVVDFTQDEDPPICKTFFSPSMSDADWAAMFGGPATTDWNGHGSWIGGNIAGALDGMGINGIAPSVGLVALKISQWCGAAYDSTILNAFLYAADHGINVVSISFGGYLDPTDPDQLTILKQYISVVNYARRKGTLIVAAAGNEHVRVGPAGLVLSHGSLTIPGDAVIDLYHQFEVPGGVPGVVDVSATGNVVVGPSASCPAGTTGGDATCKPASDTHQPTGVGKLNQLTYYSNYGPRIDIAAPGGARKFNVPNADRGGTGGFPYTTDDGYTAFETFSITSNWALEIPCFLNLGPQFYPDECYSTIQGTSMATPHVSAVAALIASQNPAARNNPALLVALLKAKAQDAHNTTPGLSATDLSAGDRTGLTCDTGYCHLGGPAVSDNEAYGAGLLDAFRPLVP
jgi:subtilisin family serine protease